MDKVFISYSSKGRPVAARLDDALRRHGVDTWSPERNLPAGSDWSAETTNALKEASAVIVVVTPAAVSSPHQQAELSIALGSSKRVIPVLAEGAHLRDLPLGLRALHAVDLGQGVDTAIEQIVRAVSQLGRSDEPPPSDSVDLQAFVEYVVEKKLASLAVEPAPTARPQNDQDDQLVFVVTSFQPDMDPAFEAVDAAAQAVGLRAERVKDVPGDYRITDRILTSIRRARLIVADLTHERPNVYFELGFARGLGKTVITIMREGTEAHFDVQDWAYLPYVDSRPLERDLLERFKYEVEQPDKQFKSSS